MITRRTFAAMVGGAAAWPVVATGQQAKMPVLGYLHSGSPTGHRARVAAFRQGLADMGYFDGQNISLEYRWAEDNFDRLPSLAKSLVERQVDVIAAAGGDVAVLAAKAATSAIPIVFAVGDDPVQQGIVASLNRPGGNLTGITFLAVELRPKMVEFLREMLPNAKTIAILANPNRSHFEERVTEVQRALSDAGLGARLIKAGNESEIEKMTRLPNTLIEIWQANKARQGQLRLGGQWHIGAPGGRAIQGDDRHIHAARPVPRFGARADRHAVRAGCPTVRRHAAQLMTHVASETEKWGKAVNLSRRVMVAVAGDAELRRKMSRKTEGMHFILQ